VVRFALVGGGITSVLAGIILGWVSWFVAVGEWDTMSPRPDRLYFDRPVLSARVLSSTLAVAPYLMLVFALGGAAQVVAESVSRASGRAARLLGEALAESPSERKPRRPAEHRPPPAGSAAEIVRPLAQDFNLEIESEPPPG
jgi:hypothetical protein